MSTTTELLAANERHNKLRAAVSALADACDDYLRIAKRGDDFERGYRTAVQGELTDLRALLETP